MSSTQDLLKEFEETLPKTPYFSILDLIEIGVFNSPSAANAAVRRKDIPSVKVSPKRTVVPRSAVISYFKNNLQTGSLKE